MSSLRPREKSKIEDLFDMSSGYVLSFSDATFGSFFAEWDIDIHASKYQSSGTSKAKKFREFWKLEEDLVVGEVILAMIDNHEDYFRQRGKDELSLKCKDIGDRLCSGGVNMSALKFRAKKSNLREIRKEIERIEKTVDSDPDSAVSSSKNLIESCCKTILDELSVSYSERNLSVVKLIRLTMKQLQLLPEDIDDKVKGGDSIRKILGSLSVIAQGMSEIRNLYGTGHGKSSQSVGLTPRHARLAVATSSALVQFLFETFECRKK